MLSGDERPRLVSADLPNDRIGELSGFYSSQGSDRPAAEDGFYSSLGSDRENERVRRNTMQPPDEYDVYLQSGAGELLRMPPREPPRNPTSGAAVRESSRAALRERSSSFSTSPRYGSVNSPGTPGLMTPTRVVISERNLRSRFFEQYRDSWDLIGGGWARMAAAMEGEAERDRLDGLWSPRGGGGRASARLAERQALLPGVREPVGTDGGSIDPATAADKGQGEEGGGRRAHVSRARSRSRARTDSASDSSKGRGLSSASFVFLLSTNMFGGSVLTLPFAFQRTGTVGGVLVVLTLAIVACHTTCLLVCEGARLRSSDMAAICGRRLGRNARRLTNGSLVYLFAAILAAYHTFLTQALCRLFQGTVAAPLMAAAVAAACLPLVMPREPKAANRLSSCGFLLICYVVLFVLIKSAQQISAEGTAPRWSGIDSSGIFGLTPGMLLGMLSPHSCVLIFATMARNRMNVVRDVRASFATVAAMMVAVGVATSGAFASEAAAVPQNFVLFFSVKDPFVASALLAVCLAIFGAYLSILYVCRVTVFGLLRSDGQAYPGVAQVAACNLAILSATTCAAASQFQGGTILSIGSAGCALIQVFCFPALMRLRVLRQRSAEAASQGSWHKALLFHLPVVGHVLVCVLGVLVLGCAVRGIVLGEDGINPPPLH